MGKNPKPQTAWDAMKDDSKHWLKKDLHEGKGCKLSLQEVSNLLSLEIKLRKGGGLVHS